jgi:thiamine biosynthesis protein ThiS
LIQISFNPSKVIEPYCDCSLSPNRLRIELNQEIIDKKKLNKKILKKGDKIEIVHFIGGG